MADLNTNEEPPQVLPSKRKPTIENLEDDSTKKLRSNIEEDNIVNKNVEKNEIEDEEEEEEEEEEEAEDYVAEEGEETDSEDEEEVTHVNGGTEGDRKGKGIMKDDYKGKGKMIEESEEDDDESESDGEDDDDDLSDDPLTEVDLDNILPSRTRRRTAPSSGVHISSDKDNDV